MVEADIHLRLVPTSIAVIYNIVELLVYAVSQTYGSTLIPLCRPSLPRILEFGSLVDLKYCHYIMVEADIHLRLLPTSIQDI